MAQLLIYFVLLLFSCTTGMRTETDWKEIGFNEPKKFYLPENLREISGLTFNNGLSDTIYAVQDENAWVFRLTLGEKSMQKTKFGKRGDYEGIAILQGEIFVLRSDGLIYRFPFEDRTLKETERSKTIKDLLPKGEYETLFARADKGTLTVLCKNCKGKGGKKTITGYTFDPKAKKMEKDHFKIDLPEFMHNDKGFNASAAAEHPISKDIYIVSSIQNNLLILDEELGFKKSISLERRVFNQPEGIIFDKDGNMYISNEGDDYHKPSILFFETF